MNTHEAPARFADDTGIERAEDMVAAAVEDQIIVLHIGSGNFYQLNRVATRIWQQLDTAATVGTLCAQLQDAFDVTPETCRTDVFAFLDDMRGRGVLRLTPPVA